MTKSVAEFLKQMHGWSFPVDLNIICGKMGISIERSIIPGYLKGYYNSGKKSIIVNSSLDRHAERLIIAMEIRQAQTKEVAGFAEKEKFAYELLTPEAEFIEVWNNSTPAQVTECARYFDVNTSMIIKRAKGLHKKKLIPLRLFRNFSDFL